MSLDYDPNRIIELATRSEADQWEMAERVHAGTLIKTQRAVAEEIGKDVAYVCRVAKVWREHGVVDPGQRPSFNEAYQAAKGAKKQKQTLAEVLREATPEQLAEAMDVPEARQVVETAIRATRPRQAPDDGPPKPEHVETLREHLMAAVGHVQRVNELDDLPWTDACEGASVRLLEEIERMETQRAIPSGTDGPRLRAVR